jgi:acetyl-CoA acetyltransferase
MRIGDAVKSLPGKEFLKRADLTCYHPDSNLTSPVIPNGYDRIAQYQMKRFGVTRRQLAMVSSLMSIMGSRHPDATTKTMHTVDQVLESTPVSSCTNLLECAKRADGGAALLVASPSFIQRKGWSNHFGVAIMGGGEGSGPLYPPPTVDEVTEDLFSCHAAAQLAYSEANVRTEDIDFFGIYDCYPICFLRGVEGSTDSYVSLFPAITLLSSGWTGSKRKGWCLDRIQVR